MKFFYSIAIVLCVVLSASAQKYVPVIKPGTVFTFEAHSNALGQSLPLTLAAVNIDSAQTLQWTLAGFGTGKFVIAAAAVENGTKIGFKQPEPDEDTKLRNNETLVTLSKATFKSLAATKTFMLNGQNFTVTQDTADFKINDKAADVFYAVNQNGKTKIWILNNPAFPLICKLVGGPQGIDLTLTAVKE